MRKRASERFKTELDNGKKNVLSEDERQGKWKQGINDSQEERIFTLEEQCHQKVARNTKTPLIKQLIITNLQDLQGYMYFF